MTIAILGNCGHSLTVKVKKKTLEVKLLYLRSRKQWIWDCSIICKNMVLPGQETQENVFVINNKDIFIFALLTDLKSAQLVKMYLIHVN